MPYREPAGDILRVFDAPPTPVPVLSPDRRRIALLEPEPHPPVAMLARPFQRLAGVRIDPGTGGQRCVTLLRGIRILDVETGDQRGVTLPDQLFGEPVWSLDGRWLALVRHAEGGKELWIVDAHDGGARRLGDHVVLDALAGGSWALFGQPGAPLHWTADGRLLATLAPAHRTAPPEPAAGPRTEETHGKRSEMATFQDLLVTDEDDDFFDYHARSRLALLDPLTGEARQLGETDLIAGYDPSPDGRRLLVSRLRRPFSHRVPWELFARTIEVWDLDGRSVATVAELPVADEVPRQGVPVGPRALGWQANRPATLVWTEALDGGDPMVKVPHRDALRRLEAPFEGAPHTVRLIEHRLAGRAWLPEPDQVLIWEYDRDRRWRVLSRHDLSRAGARQILFDLSVNDAYADPGSPVMEARPDGTAAVVVEDGAIFLAGAGASETGFRPFLDLYDLGSGEKRRLFTSRADGLESFVAFAPGGRSRILVAHQTPAEPPNLHVADLAGGGRRALTDQPDPFPELTGAVKAIVRYRRADGVPLSGTLHLPPGERLGARRLPLIVWAYPMDFSDPDTAGQVRASDQTFTRPAPLGPLWFLLRGWAVLEGAAMPVVGDPDTMNDTFVEQVVASARAAIDELDRMGVVDRGRVVVGGHSYGGFMTATLLAHSDLFAAGLARSGAYNRTLTPFGFQTERRSFWEAPQVYLDVSPFAHADKIKAPILLIHGAADSNSGTYPLQSERLFQALQGLGGTARLVVLPHEDHAYRARESVLQVIAEQLDWVERWAGARDEAREAVSAEAPPA